MLQLIDGVSRPPCICPPVAGPIRKLCRDEVFEFGILGIQLKRSVSSAGVAIDIFFTYPSHGPVAVFSAIASLAFVGLGVQDVVDVLNDATGLADKHGCRACIFIYVDIWIVLGDALLNKFPCQGVWLSKLTSQPHVGQ